MSGPLAPTRRARLRRRLQRGQAMIEYSFVSWAVLVGAIGAGWPFTVRLLNALNRYFQSIYYVLGLPI